MAVTAGLVAGLLSQNAVSACVPTALTAATLASLSAAGRGTVAGVVSANVAALVEGVVKTMLFTKLKIATALLMAVALAATAAGLVGIQTRAAAFADDKKDSKPQANKREEKTSNLVRVASQVKGIVEFIGTEIKAGEKVPSEEVITLQIGSEKKTFRRLTKGDAVVEGQLLAQLDDRLARADLTAREQKVVACKADLAGAKAIAQEAEAKYHTAEELKRRNAIALEEYRSAVLTRDKMYSDSIVKQEAYKLAEIEVNVSKVICKQFEIRSRVNGVIARIHKRPGEAVQELETVLEIELAPPAPK